MYSTNAYLNWNKGTSIFQCNHCHRRHAVVQIPENNLLFFNYFFKLEVRKKMKINSLCLDENRKVNKNNFTRILMELLHCLWMIWDKKYPRALRENNDNLIRDKTKSNIEIYRAKYLHISYWTKFQIIYHNCKTSIRNLSFLVKRFMRFGSNY